MMPLKILSFLLVFVHSLCAFSIAVPEPKEMLAQADVVAVATLSKKGGDWTLSLKEVLKGDYDHGDVVTLSTSYPEIAFSLDLLAPLVKDAEFLFVGKQSPSGRTLQPNYGLCSVWPQGTNENLLPQRTPADATAFAKWMLGPRVPKPSAAAKGISARWWIIAGAGIVGLIGLAGLLQKRCP